MSRRRYKAGKIELLTKDEEDALDLYEAEVAQWRIDNAAAIAAIQNTPTLEEKLNGVLEWIGANAGVGPIPGMGPGLTDVFSRHDAAKRAAVAPHPVKP